MEELLDDSERKRREALEKRLDCELEVRKRLEREIERVERERERVEREKENGIGERIRKELKAILERR